MTTLQNQAFVFSGMEQHLLDHGLHYAIIYAPQSLHCLISRQSRNKRKSIDIPKHPQTGPLLFTLVSLHTNTQVIFIISPI